MCFLWLLNSRHDSCFVQCTPEKEQPINHWGRVTHICVGKHWFRWWLVAWTAPNRYLNQCCYIVNWTLENKLQRNFNRNSNISIQENALENGVCEMASIFSRPQSVKPLTAWSNHIFRWVFHSLYRVLFHDRLINEQHHYDPKCH